MEVTQREQLIGQFLDSLPTSAKPHLAAFLTRYPELSKSCGQCAQTLPLQSFATKIAAKGRLQSYCRDCSAGVSRKNYEENTEAVKARTKVSNAKRIAVNREYVNQYIQKCSCSVCGTKNDLFFQTADLARPTAVHMAVNGSLSIESVNLAIQNATVFCRECYGIAQGQRLQEAARYRKALAAQGLSAEALVPKDCWKKYQGIKGVKKGVVEVHPVTVTRIEQKAAESLAAVLYTVQVETLKAVKEVASLPDARIGCAKV